MEYTYVLYSKTADKFYIGSSNNPQRRLFFHNKGLGGKRAFTKRARDWKLIWQRKFETKNESLRMEKKLKSFKNRKYLIQYIGTISPVAQR